MIGDDASIDRVYNSDVRRLRTRQAPLAFEEVEAQVSAAALDVGATTIHILNHYLFIRGFLPAPYERIRDYVKQARSFCWFEMETHLRARYIFNRRDHAFGEQYYSLITVCFCMS
jgi:hypothetical protein